MISQPKKFLFRITMFPTEDKTAIQIFNTTKTVRENFRFSSKTILVKLAKVHKECKKDSIKEMENKFKDKAITILNLVRIILQEATRPVFLERLKITDILLTTEEMIAVVEKEIRISSTGAFK